MSFHLAKILRARYIQSSKKTSVTLSQEGAELVKKVRGKFLFRVTGAKGLTKEWLVDLSSGTGAVIKNPSNASIQNISRPAIKLCIPDSVNKDNLYSKQGYNVSKFLY